MFWNIFSNLVVQVICLFLILILDFVFFSPTIRRKIINKRKFSRIQLAIYHLQRATKTYIQLWKIASKRYGNFRQRSFSQVKITSQTQPDASPSVGLRLVGLLPCAVWSPKIPKPTIGQIQRVQATPYTVTSAASSIRSANVLADPANSAQPQVNRLLVTAQRNETSTSSCRCTTTIPSNSVAEQLIPNHISVNQQSTSTRPITTIASINPSSTINQRATNLRPHSSTLSGNPMLLVPFAAMPPGFVPQIPVVASATVPPTATTAYRK